MSRVEPRQRRVRFCFLIAFLLGSPVGQAALLTWHLEVDHRALGAIAAVEVALNDALLEEAAVARSGYPVHPPSDGPVQPPIAARHIAPEPSADHAHHPHHTHSHPHEEVEERRANEHLPPSYDAAVPHEHPAPSHGAPTQHEHPTHSHGAAIHHDHPETPADGRGRINPSSGSRTEAAPASARSRVADHGNGVHQHDGFVHDHRDLPGEALGLHR